MISSLLKEVPFKLFPSICTGHYISCKWFLLNFMLLTVDTRVYIQLPQTGLKQINEIVGQVSLSGKEMCLFFPPCDPLWPH